MICLIQTEREFSQMCIKRGFLRRAPRFYVRCIGDGVYQSIYTGFKKYIQPESPNYSAQKRKSYYISIGLRSIYSCYDEHVFSADKDSGGYAPSDLIYKCRYSGPFNGIESDYQHMECRGFDILDEICTQEKLIEWWDAVQVVDIGHRIHDIHLVEPLLLCGNIKDAQGEISASFIQDIDAYVSYLDYVDSGVLSKDDSYDQRIRCGAKHQLKLWRYCIGRNNVGLHEYIEANYVRNMAWVQKYGIPATSLIQHRVFRVCDSLSSIA